MQPLSDTLLHYILNTGCYLFGVATGILATVYIYEHPKPAKPVVVEIERSVLGRSADHSEQIRRLEAKVEAHYTQQMQRQKEVRFKTDKLELAKQVHDTQLVTAQDGADHIRQMARELGITSAVLK